MELRAFQTTAVASIASMLRSSTSALLQSPTGSGKTVIASAFIRDWLKNSSTNTVLCLVPTQSLVDQVYRTLKALGVTAEVLHDTITRSQDGSRYRAPHVQSRVIITMPETYLNTLAGNNTLSMPVKWQPTLLVVDEVHKGTSSSFQGVRDRYPEVRVLGLTATPFRAKNEQGEHLQDWFGSNIIRTIGIDELIHIGQLVPPQYFSFAKDAHVVRTWQTATATHGNRRTIVFSRDTAHSFEIQRAFVAEGVTAEVITAGSETLGITPQTPLQRQAIFDRFHRGTTEVLISMYALCEGFDEPAAHVCMILREVGNIALYQQMVGRVLRCHSSKSEGIILDFGGNVKSYGAVETHVWEMQEIRNNSMCADGRSEIAYDSWAKRSAVYFTCVECSHVWDIKQSKTCKHCGTPHGVSVTAELGQHLREVLSVPVRDNKALGAVMSRIRAVHTAAPTVRAQYAAMANRNIGAAVFDASGEFSKGFEFLAALSARSNTRLTDRVQFVSNSG